MANTFIDNTGIRTDSITNSDNTGAPTMAFGVKNSNGSAAAPSVTFTSSPTTGLFRKAADSVGFSAAGVEIGSFSSAGAWILGSSGSGNNNLLVNGSSQISTATTTTGTADSFLRNSNASLSVRIQGDFSGSTSKMRFYSNATENGSYNEAGSWTLGPTTAIGGSSYAGNNIIGRTNGTAVPAGYIGETVTSQPANFTQTSPVLNTVYNIGTLSIPSAGIWLVKFFTAQELNATGANQFAQIDLASSGGTTVYATPCVLSPGQASGDAFQGGTAEILVRTTGAVTITASTRHTNFKTASPGTPTQIGAFANQFIGTRVA